MASLKSSILLIGTRVHSSVGPKDRGDSMLPKPTDSRDRGSVGYASLAYCLDDERKRPERVGGTVTGPIAAAKLRRLHDVT